jgi:hypothetical protein
MNVDFWFWGFCTVCGQKFPNDVSGAAADPIFTGDESERSDRAKTHNQNQDDNLQTQNTSSCFGLPGPSSGRC